VKLPAHRLSRIVSTEPNARNNPMNAGNNATPGGPGSFAEEPRRISTRRRFHQ
jgi:hypothetical protein